MPDVLTALKNENYISLETYRKDGTAIAVPVWLEELDGKLVFITDGTSFKAKRMRNNPQVRFAACDIRGKKVHGEWFDGTAEIIEAGERKEKISALMRRKYGLSALAISLLATVTGKAGVRVGVAITPKQR